MLNDISIVPVFGWWPVWMWVFGLCIYFVPVRLAMAVLDDPFPLHSRREVYEGVWITPRQYWPSFKWGSLIFIPLYLAFAAQALQEGWRGSDAFYASPWYNFGLLVACLIISVGINRHERESGDYTDDQMWCWSKLLHLVGLALALHFGLAAGLPLSLVLVSDPNLWALLAFASITGFAVTVGMDNHPKFRPNPRYTH